MSLILSFCIFYLSFTPLWISVVFVDIMSIVKCSPTIWTEKISIVLILIVFILSMLFLYFGLKGRNGDNVEKYTLKSAYEEKSITVEYLLSYILPLFAFDFTTWEGVALFAIFFATLGFLCIKHSFFCVNIVLELFNYSFYHTNHIFFLICRKKIFEHNFIGNKNTCNISYTNRQQRNPLRNINILEVCRQIYV